MFWDKIKHFKKSEFACNCGCGFNIINHDLVKKLDLARDLACVPFVITSGCRCSSYNNLVGGSHTSSHLLGLAVDIDVIDSHARYSILVALLGVRISRIGIYREFIHADIDIDKSNRVIWYK